MKEFIKVIQQEHYSYKDPIVEFLACVFINYDFDGAQKKMKECEEVKPFICFIVFHLVMVQDDIINSLTCYYDVGHCE